MELPEYVNFDEVKRVCKEVGLSDWTKKKDPLFRMKKHPQFSSIG